MKRAPLVLSLLLSLTVAGIAAADEKAVCMDAHEHGQEVRLANHWVEARRLFLTCAQASCPTLIVQDCTRWVGELSVELPSLVVSARRPDGSDVDDATLSIDGAAFATRLPAVPIPLDPGEHVLRFEHAGWGPIEKRIILHGGEHERSLVAAFSVPPGLAPASGEGSVATRLADAPRRPVWGYVATGAAIAAAGASVTLLAVGKVDEHDLASSACGQAGTCTNAQVNPIRVDYVASAAIAGVAAAFVAVAVWQLASHKGSAATASAWPLQVAF